MSGWADRAIAELIAGRSCTIRPRGNSMRPRVLDGQEVTLFPCSSCIPKPFVPKPGDVVLARVRGRVYLHLVKALGPRGVLIGNNHGGVNGWTSLSNVYGVMVE